MTDHAVLQKQEFGQSIGMGKRPALLIVDFVNGFLDPDMFGGGNIIEAATQTSTLLAAARSGGHPVIFTRIVYAEDGSDAGIWCRKVPRLKLLTESAPASQITEILEPLPG
ncbi:MAG: isochorismatase family protein, partial [bacterium]|nr:isochorismatase family protein [bacterium]